MYNKNWGVYQFKEQKNYLRLLSFFLSQQVCLESFLDDPLSQISYSMIYILEWYSCTQIIII